MNQNKQCRDCIWADLCDQDNICDHYYPSDGEDFGETIEELRRQYDKDWIDYTAEYN